MANTFKRKISRSIVDSASAIGAYTVPVSTQVTVIGLTVTNTDNITIKVDVALYDGSNSTYLVKGADIPVGGALIVVGGEQKLVLEPGDSVRVNTDSASNTCDAIMSVLEIS